MSKEPRALAEMEPLAQQLRTHLESSCQRIMVAGSIRRKKELVGDIELVAIPRMTRAGLFGDREESALYRRLNALPLDWMMGNNPEGRYYKLYWPAHQVQIDLFLAQPDNFGLIKMIRTGSADFAQAMLARWKKRQGLGPTLQGSINGRLVDAYGTVVPTPEELDVFAACQVEYVPPQERTDGRVLRDRVLPYGPPRTERPSC